ncbi:TetR/AcrR family transcriptional regulator [Faecalicatena contorta]|uniref:TetR/AcrR family transcriptional regulator n=1 Tax=Faecalicatena fissicatena TaxID=290055 RepID=A0ABS2E6X2_9FIRM|nr:MULTISPECIES: TetR/AcrR family transcriptional regulator [Clostridia]MBM6686539.1 TetR/AcrR family transcriptional regulator [Faecalicatena contorta]MBM6711906.1 TetR/AcrR family transcriptional regulator [Faecalicatena contorta]MBM6737354.1 TetR/AcrR family transcriptional regulator [Faecalicatena fissicatena]
MDLRIEKTERAIRNAFMELRARMPLEKIRVRELCAAACINKSTFYAHYTDIYALSETLEKETVASIVSSIPDLKGHSAENPDVFTRALCLAFLSNISLIKILFSGKEQSRFGVQLEGELKKVIYRKYPEYERDPEKDILLSYCIQGTYHAYLNNPSVDTESFVRVVEQIVRCLKPMF